MPASTSVSMVAWAKLVPRVASIVAPLTSAASVYGNVADSWCAGIVTVDGMAPALAGLSVSVTVEPPAGAGMSSVTVNVAVPLGLTRASAGVSDAIAGASLG